MWYDDKVFTSQRHIINTANRVVTVGETVNISTYGFYVGKYGETRDFLIKHRDNARILIGSPYMKMCKPECNECLNKYHATINRIEDGISDLGINAKIVDRLHLKYYRFGPMVVVGGINLTGSAYKDCSVSVSARHIKAHLDDEFNSIWYNRRSMC